MKTYSYSQVQLTFWLYRFTSKKKTLRIYWGQALFRRQAHKSFEIGLWGHKRPSLQVIKNQKYQQIHDVVFPLYNRL